MSQPELDEKLYACSADCEWLEGSGNAPSILFFYEELALEKAA